MSGPVASVPAVRVSGVVKHFGTAMALDGAVLEIPSGMVFGLLGPNGAGKTTLVRILATLLTPDAGRAEVFGHDVVREPAAVRELLGLTGQFAVEEAAAGLRQAQIGVSDIGLRRPTLDDVFLQLTGAPPSVDGDADGPLRRAVRTYPG